MSILQNQILEIDTKVGLLADRIATEFNYVDDEIGQLSSLTTTNKSSIVEALNEVQTTASDVVSGIDGGNF
jgi:hypothetical protein